MTLFFFSLLFAKSRVPYFSKSRRFLRIVGADWLGEWDEFNLHSESEVWRVKVKISFENARQRNSIEENALYHIPTLEMDFDRIFEVPFFWASGFIQLLLCSTNIFTGYRPLGIFCCFNSVIIFKPARWNNFLTNSSGLVTELSSSSISTFNEFIR